MHTQTDSRALQVRRLNDRFRCAGSGRGSLMLTSGVHELGATFAWAAIAAVRAFNDFTRDNDQAYIG